MFSIAIAICSVLNPNACQFGIVKQQFPTEQACLVDKKKEVADLTKKFKDGKLPVIVRSAACFDNSKIEPKPHVTVEPPLVPPLTPQQKAWGFRQA